MKNLHDFISEEEKSKSKPHASKDKGADDKKYVRMMEEYKRLRRRDTEKANELLEKIFELGRKGDVSDLAKIAGAYI